MTDKQPLEDRVNNRSQRPESAAFREFIAANWAEPDGALPPQMEAAPYAATRREVLSTRFPGERLVIPAGELVVRSNDTDYRFRPHSAFAHLTGLGTDEEPDAVLVLEPTETGHDATLYFRPAAAKDTEEFFADSRYGELWVGVRPTLEEMSARTGLPTAHSDELADAISKDAGQVQIRLASQADSAVTALVQKARSEVGAHAEGVDAPFAEALSELRLVKDEWEIRQMRDAVNATHRGFDALIRQIPRSTEHWRGERVLEGAFEANAREDGNGLGYDTIAAAGNHANTLHWIRNDGQVRPGELVLVDAGVEVDSLYTADITRTIPVDGTFTDAQKKVYQAVLDACEACLAKAAEIGPDGERVHFREIHAAAMEVLAHRLDEWGLLPVSAEESLKPEGQYHRRWMVHGTSHHLGLDVHDCAQARREMYLDAKLEPGMCFTIEPALYFREDDLAVPEELRGIGVRIEDDILVTESGVERLSEDIPRTIPAVEAWVQGLLQ
ncbi:Xaa-Pro aminopeptidase [Ruaniaceae bacterium KH17]|nr:Xaa-Pro aminopeptidase [Ruaniaceae bacterium KH17]